MPSPSKAPASSAEVAPNAEMPPPPPPPPPPPQSRGSVSPSSAAATTPARPGKPGASRSNYDATAAAQSPGYIDLARLLDNSANRYAKENNLPASPADQPLVRTRPVTGRTVFPRLNAQGGDLSDPQLLFNNLNKMLARQKVKHLMHRQKFHERPGVKRKRLVMERWRKRFKAGFKATASRVMDLKRQGW
ncbi:hypothetical protein N3K66_007646 [Trichothecium roseum]|uniref:Uncharacterized protein n=1 Tax=Trichothecium roseum TaxID=47278 RepID=A0ACC0UUK4_9HYPO|nr:hypothetical protein N3K66_007646 [Trichothecium roseum]